jgi:hypothetical protein
MSNPDTLIAYCNLWLILFGYILGLYTTLFILMFLDHQEEESEEEEPAPIELCAWCWYEQHPYAFGFPGPTTSSNICRWHAAEQRRLRQIAKALLPGQSVRRKEALYAD